MLTRIEPVSWPEVPGLGADRFFRRCYVFLCFGWSAPGGSRDGLDIELTLVCYPRKYFFHGLAVGRRPEFEIPAQATLFGVEVFEVEIPDTDDPYLEFA